ncbi:unnamed protein product [Acanthoscelides obtectus]|uniref:Uncharacterized protein n=1 Tax=Acanthoscelides obtectus TaxID=200917 RepID=A0A9P0PN22_ACAOB|nr:unnamed protein product [Acanthoscelides obtectus]CAK1675966.1 hypothetical protein AOBTE_LOCUS30517 [Acanthoscelides obtectus]
MYSTPSNSVILHETYTCGVIHNQDSVARLEAERNISRKGRRESCRCRSAVAHPWFNKVKEESESSHEGYVGGCQCCCAKANKSSTEESIEILNIQCQCCCKSQSKSPPKPRINNGQTQTCPGQKAEMVQTAICGCVGATQTQNMKQIKSTKKKKIVVCCHCCCHCIRDDAGGEDDKVQVNRSNWDNVKAGDDRPCFCIQAANNQNAPSKRLPSKEQYTSCDYNGITCNTGEKAAENEYGVYQGTTRQEKMNPAHLKQFKPWDASLYQQKQFPKYGAPSKKYPWVQRTSSDILDKYYKLKISEEFSSPVTGKTYNLSPIEPLSLDGESIRCSLPEPIEVSEDIEYLEKLESNAKHNDIPSRIMLNAMCDAILYNNIDAECPSMLLSEFTYLDKAAGGCSENNCFSSKSVDLPSDNLTNGTKTQAADETVIKQQVEDTVKKLMQEKEERLSGADNTFKHMDRLGLQKEFQQEDGKDHHTTPGCTNNFGSKQHCCFREDEEHTITPRVHPSFTKTGLLPSVCPYKRSASPARTGQGKKSRTGQVKKSRPCFNGEDSMVQNVNALLDKIDEIAVRSQENDLKVQSVLNSIGNPDQYHLEQTSELRSEASISAEISSSDIFRKIDEIVQRSQLNNNKIQTVLNTIPKMSTTNPREFVVNQAPPCISSDDCGVMMTEKLSSISEVTNETAETKVEPISSAKLDVSNRDGNTKKKKKRGSLKSLIPIKQKPKNK